jgi:hypothetical protein
MAYEAESQISGDSTRFQDGIMCPRSKQRATGPIFRLVEWHGEVPRVITLCGSTKFMEDFIAETRRLTLDGHIVISVGLFGHREGLAIGSESEPTPVKVALDELHKRKIDLADAIHVVNSGGYIGSSTQSEIDYAEAHGKHVTYMVPPGMSAACVNAIPE